MLISFLGTMEFVLFPVPNVGCLQADLMEIGRWSRFNNNYKYLLNIVDIYSRYAWSIPIKTKKPSEVALKLKPIFEKLKNNRMTFTVDNGNEFNGDVNKLLDKYNIKKYVNDPESLQQHTHIVERFNIIKQN